MIKGLCITLITWVLEKSEHWDFMSPIKLIFNKTSHIIYTADQQVCQPYEEMCEELHGETLPPQKLTSLAVSFLVLWLHQNLLHEHSVIQGLATGIPLSYRLCKYGNVKSLHNFWSMGTAMIFYTGGRHHSWGGGLIQIE